MADGQFDVRKIGLSQAEAPGPDHYALIMDTENADAMTIITGDPITSFVLGNGSLIEITPAQLTANTDDWNPTGQSSANVLRISSDAARNLSGIVAAGLSPFAKRKTLINVGNFAITLKHLVGSAAANQFKLSGGGDIILQPDDVQDIYYDDTDTKWRSV